MRFRLLLVLGLPAAFALNADAAPTPSKATLTSHLGINWAGWVKGVGRDAAVQFTLTPEAQDLSSRTAPYQCTTTGVDADPTGIRSSVSVFCDVAGTMVGTFTDCGPADGEPHIAVLSLGPPQRAVQITLMCARAQQNAAPPVPRGVLH